MYTDYLDFAKNLAHQAGAVMLEHFKLGVDFESKHDASPVTEADKSINDIVISAVHERFPGHTVRGEEASTQQEGDRFVWVCDPIDGTYPYTYGIPTNLFSLALCDDGKPIVAVCYDPYLDRLYYATKDGGAYVNNDPLRVNNTTTLKNTPVGASGPNNTLPEIANIRNDLHKQGALMFLLLCSVYESLLVAAGQFSAVVFPGNTAHDVAAVKLIVEEAGGIVTDLSGQEQRYDQPINGAIISNGHLHQPVLEIVNSHR